jgi:hypothetical protein
MDLATRLAEALLVAILACACASEEPAEEPACVDPLLGESIRSGEMSAMVACEPIETFGFSFGAEFTDGPPRSSLVVYFMGDTALWPGTHELDLDAWSLCDEVFTSPCPTPRRDAVCSVVFVHDIDESGRLCSDTYIVTAGSVRVRRAFGDDFLAEMTDIVAVNGESTITFESLSLTEDVEPYP